MKQSLAQASRDRAQIALHVLALTRAAMQPHKPASHDCGVTGPAHRALSDRPTGEPPAWAAVNPFRSSDPSPGPLSQLVAAHRTSDDALVPQTALASNVIVIARATARSCPALRRRLKERCGCVRHVAGRPRPTALKTTQSALHMSNVLSVLAARPRPLRKPRCWLEAPDPVSAGIERWARHVPPGWQGLLEQTLLKLLAMARSPARRSALQGLTVFCHGVGLGFSLPADGDAALLGVARRAEAASQCICSTCGSPGRRREIGEEDRATLCARCAARPLLHWDIWELQQSLRFLRAVNVPVGESQIPALLRSSFRRQASAHPEDFSPQGKVRMSPARFLAWAAQWQAIGERIAGGPDWREANARPRGIR